MKITRKGTGALPSWLLIAVLIAVFAVPGAAQDGDGGGDGPDDETIAARIADLGDPDWAVREAAQAWLEARLPRCRTRLETAAEEAELLEVRLRAREILTGARWGVTPDLARVIGDLMDGYAALSGEERRERVNKVMQRASTHGDLPRLMHTIWWRDRDTEVRTLVGRRLVGMGDRAFMEAIGATLVEPDTPRDERLLVCAVLREAAERSLPPDLAARLGARALELPAGEERREVMLALVHQGAGMLARRVLTGVQRDVDLRDTTLPAALGEIVDGLGLGITAVSTVDGLESSAAVVGVGEPLALLHLAAGAWGMRPVLDTENNQVTVVAAPHGSEAWARDVREEHGADWHGRGAAALARTAPAPTEEDLSDAAALATWLARTSGVAVAVAPGADLSTRSGPAPAGEASLAEHMGAALAGTGLAAGPFHGGILVGPAEPLQDRLRVHEFLPADAASVAAALAHEQPAVRVAGLVYGAASADGLALEDVRPLLTDPDARVRRAAVRALPLVRGEDRLTPVLERLRDDDEEVRDAAAEILDSLPEEHASARIGLWARDHADAPELRTRITGLLADMGPRGSPGLAILRRAWSDDADMAARIDALADEPYLQPVRPYGQPIAERLQRGGMTRMVDDEPALEVLDGLLEEWEAPHLFGPGLRESIRDVRIRVRLTSAGSDWRTPPGHMVLKMWVGAVRNDVDVVLVGDRILILLEDDTRRIHDPLAAAWQSVLVTGHPEARRAAAAVLADHWIAAGVPDLLAEVATLDPEARPEETSWKEPAWAAAEWLALMNVAEPLRRLMAEVEEGGDGSEDMAAALQRVTGDVGRERLVDVLKQVDAAREQAEFRR